LKQLVVDAVVAVAVAVVEFEIVYDQFQETLLVILFWFFF
jgi:hypothetical protein